MSRTLTVVNYAVNGSGVGHLTRLVAVSRWIRRYAAHAGVRAEIYFLTSSEADGLLFHEGFAAFKMPSKTAVGEAGIDKATYLALAKQWVWHSLGLMRPDLLVVDTFPRGAFGELLSALDLARRRALVLRPVKESFAARADFQAMLPLYDAILVPDGAEVLVPPEAGPRVHRAGPVMVRERVELAERAAVRAELGIAPDRLAVYLSAGGGGDAAAEAQLLGAIRALAGEPDLHLVVGAGPLYRGRQLGGERVTWLARPGAAELLPAFDVAVCAAGYNTFHELMHAGMPSIFLPQEKIADEQDARAARAAAAGAAAVLPALDPAALRGALDAWRDPGRRARAAAAARALVPRNHARELAAELLRLVLPPADVDAAVDGIGDDLLGRARALGLALEPFLEAARALDPARAGDPAEVTAAAVALVELFFARGIPLAAGLRFLAILGRKLSGAAPAERAEAARQLIEALLPFGDWAGAALLLKALAAERQLDAAAFAGALSSFLGRLRARGHDLYRGLAHLSEAQGTGPELPSNGDLLRAAGDRLP